MNTLYAVSYNFTCNNNDSYYFSKKPASFAFGLNHRKDGFKHLRSKINSDLKDFMESDIKNKSGVTVGIIFLKLKNGSYTHSTMYIDPLKMRPPLV